ncbi:MAG: o-succinylbenzoate synthase [Isosphaeraceae bacterium]|nr:o-succinylbenzoate synthase [Isosphaeraceae bacterium]
MTTRPIERVRLDHVQIPLKEPFRISGGEVTVKDAIVVTLETSDAEGLGESSAPAASFGYSSDTPEGCFDDLVQRIAPRLIGRTVSTVEEIAEIAAEWEGCSRFAIAGAETALWDLLGKARRISIAELLGTPSEVEARGVESGLAVGLYPTVVELLRSIEAHLVEGYRRLKIKIAPGRDLALVEAVRTHFGDIPLMVDANAAYDRSSLDLFRALDDFDLLMFEQPFAADDLEGSALLQKSVNTPVCLDESADTLAHTIQAIEMGACKVVNLKLQRVGGYGPSLAIHDACAARGVACWVGTMPELGIGQAHGLHLATLCNCRYPSDIEPSARWFVDDFVAPHLELNGPGLFALPMRPGLGFQVDHARLRRYHVREQLIE